MEGLPPTALAILCLWVITDRRIHTGVLVTGGLGLIAAASLALLDDAWVYRAVHLMIYGCILVVSGLLWGRYVAPWFARLRLKE